MRYFLRLSLFALIFESMTACSGVQKNEPNISGDLLIEGKLNTLSVITKQANSSYPLALVLGGGGLRGYAHIGVLQALNEAGIYPDLVVGTSVGAVIGAAYSSGLSPQEIWSTAKQLDTTSLIDVAFRGPGILKGESLAKWINELVNGKQIERLPISFAAVATDITNSSPYIISSGDTGEAVRASSAIPGVFLPVNVGQQVLVDGGVVALVPVNAAKALGAKKVIAVDIYCNSPRYTPDSMPSIWLLVSQVQGCLLSETEKLAANIVISPSVISPKINDPDSRELARKAGYLSAQHALPMIIEMLNSETAHPYQK